MEESTVDHDNKKDPPILRVSNAPPIYRHVSELSSYFGTFGGCYVAETLVAAHEELALEYVKASQDPVFRQTLESLGRDYIGRPTPMYHAKRLSLGTDTGTDIQIFTVLSHIDR